MLTRRNDDKGDALSPLTSRSADGTEVGGVWGTRVDGQVGSPGWEALGGRAAVGRLPVGPGCSPKRGRSMARTFPSPSSTPRQKPLHHLAEPGGRPSAANISSSYVHGACARKFPFHSGFCVRFVLGGKKINRFGYSK